MKAKILTLFIVSLMSASAVAEEERVPLYSCTLNKSVNMNILYEYGDDDYGRQIVLQTQFWNGTNLKDVITFIHPTVIEYGDVFTVIKNKGRGGYAMIRIDLKEDIGSGDHVYKAHLDINLFDINGQYDQINTNGYLVETYCRKIRGN
ncbi:hypothetical protein ACFLRA_01885 [Bdellovibrionota bacterium]